MDYKSGYKFFSDISPVFVEKILPLIKEKVTVDLGCGQGSYLSLMSSKSLGLDISKENLRSGRQKKLNVKWADMNHAPRLGTKFEAVFSSHLIEHLENPVSFLKYAGSLVKKRGILVLAIPNEYSYICLKYPYFNGRGNHLYSFSIRNMKELLEHAGYKVKYIYRDYYTALSKRLGVNRFLSIIDIFPDSLRDYFAWSFWFVAEKK